MVTRQTANVSRIVEGCLWQLIQRVGYTSGTYRRSEALVSFDDNAFAFILHLRDLYRFLYQWISGLLQITFSVSLSVHSINVICLHCRYWININHAHTKTLTNTLMHTPTQRKEWDIVRRNTMKGNRNPSSPNPQNPNGHNVAVSRVTDKFYVNDDDKAIYECNKQFVMKFVNLIAFS